MQLLGRASERERLRAVLDDARAGRGNALVVRGEAGMGKTALLADAIASQSEFTVTRLDGIESEMELPYAGLHRLLLPFTNVVDELPQRQRDAVHSAFGTGDAPEAPDRFAVGLATLSILDRAATRSPLLCVVDDVQWVDRDSLDALALAGRRLGAERVAMLFSGREDVQCASLDGLPVLHVDGLAADDAVSLVRHAVDGGLPDHVAANVVRATGGTPLAIIELGRAFSADPAVVAHHAARATPDRPAPRGPLPTRRRPPPRTNADLSAARRRRTLRRLRRREQRRRGARRQWRGR